MATDSATEVKCSSVVERIGEKLIARLPKEASGELSSRGQVAVEAVVNGRDIGVVVVEPDGRRGHWLNGETLAAAGADEGDSVEAELRPTKAWPEPDVPDDLRQALDEAPAEIRETWEDITPMARWEWVRWVKATKNPDTRARRVEVSISKMESGKRRPCCFDLSSCTDPELAKSGKLIETAA